MKKKAIATTLFPTVYTFMITILTLIATSPLNINGTLDFVKGLIVVSLVVLFPLLILIQSIISTVNHFNVLIPLGISILSTMLFIIVLHIGDTRGLLFAMIGYAIIYFIDGIVGYVIGKIICKFKSSKKIKEIY